MSHLVTNGSHKSVLHQRYKILLTLLLKIAFITK